MSPNGSVANLTSINTEGLEVGEVISLADYNRLPAGYRRRGDWIETPDGGMATPEHLSSLGLGQYAFTGYHDRRNLPVFSEIDPHTGELSESPRDVALARSPDSNTVVCLPVNSADVRFPPPPYRAETHFLPDYRQNTGPFADYIARRNAPRPAAEPPHTQAVANPSLPPATGHALRRQPGTEDLRSARQRVPRSRESAGPTQHRGRTRSRSR
jgi:hypothetical protein